MRGRLGIAPAVVAAVAVAIVLSRPGGGLPTRPASSVPALLSEPAGVPGAGLVLTPDGLGPISFGDDAGTVIARLTELLGAPVEEGLLPCDAESDVVGWVRWGNLSVAFAEGGSAATSSTIHPRAYGWMLRRPKVSGSAPPPRS